MEGHHCVEMCDVGDSTLSQPWVGSGGPRRWQWGPLWGKRVTELLSLCCYHPGVLPVGRALMDQWGGWGGLLPGATGIPSSPDLVVESHHPLFSSNPGLQKLEYPNGKGRKDHYIAVSNVWYLPWGNNWPVKHRASNILLQHSLTSCALVAFLWMSGGWVLFTWVLCLWR